ncbi:MULTISPECIES: DUF1289 domain-containing protein [Shewanella]|uniref:DUF1289 domain-containing protein n=1 Tax=Shewanella sedimentimangrovi TaxID=2814293 RepID=A0ABX7QXV9_9GAMM|nr:MULTISPECIES: DUF1289 domain-containing protein [Shewanella]QSX35800.1 DUF1289 domain-containing protein [Shewanella sedimentimangrovi]QSX42203.1 DUF1289 domain-containing protein [Shewanella cyperi]
MNRQSLPSPCVRNCCLDEADVCLGCGRTLEEVLRWHHADLAEQQAILERAQSRLAKRQLAQPLQDY